MRLIFFNEVFAGRAIQALCWTFIHSLWQGLAFIIITGLVMTGTKKSSARMRYNILTALFFLFIAVCAVTFIREFVGSSNGEMAAQSTLLNKGTNNSFQLMFKKFSDYFSANASVIVMLWFIVFCFKCVRMMSSVVYSQRVKSHKIHEPSAVWKNKIVSLSNLLQIKRTVLLLESEIVKIPVVIGHLKPVIFIPLGLLNNMPAGEIEAVLLHELAHIRRNDYFVNFIQIIAENIFFFNPALLWVSSLLREERENCCDDIAIKQTKSKKQFIQALISFKEHALNVSNYSTAFPARKNQLFQRVARIVNNRNKTLNPAEKIFFLISFVLLSAMLTVVSGGQVVHNKISNSIKGQQAKDVAPAQIVPQLKTQQLYNIDKQTYYTANAEGGEKLPVQKHDPVTIEIYTKTIDDQKQLAKIDSKQIKAVAVKPLTDEQQAESDKLLAVKEQLDAVKEQEQDKKQALDDKAQAIKDQEQARLDRIEAQKDQEQALLDMKQAELDKKQALKDQEQAEKDKKPQQ